MSLSQIPKSTSLVNEYAKSLSLSFSELRHQVDEKTIEELAIFLLRTMGSESRDYHRPEHSIDVSKLAQPIPRLAGLFHDLIYLQVDSSWKNIKHLLEPFVPSDTFEVNVTEALKKTNDPWLHAIAALFKFESTTVLSPASGINEFLSAIVMYRKLQSLLTQTEMIRAVACIETTIFIDRLTKEEKTQVERLRSNLNRAVKKLELEPFTDFDFREAFLDCQNLIERDLSSFAAADLSSFVSNTWNVMIENNQPLRNSYYLCAEYRKAVHGTVSFIRTLDANKMFWDQQSKMIAPTSYNLRVGMYYLKAFGLSLSVIEAIALASGGDAPYEMLVGPMKRSREHMTQTLNDLLPIPEVVEGDRDIKEVFRILWQGRSFRSRFDQKNAPLAAYLYSQLGNKKTLDFYEKAVAFHSQQDLPPPEAAIHFLKELPQHTLSVILESVSRTALSRKDRISYLLQELEKFW